MRKGEYREIIHLVCKLSHCIFYPFFVLLSIDFKTIRIKFKYHLQYTILNHIGYKSGRLVKPSLPLCRIMLRYLPERFLLLPIAASPTTAPPLMSSSANHIMRLPSIPVFGGSGSSGSFSAIVSSFVISFVASASR